MRANLTCVRRPSGQGRDAESGHCGAGRAGERRAAGDGGAARGGARREGHHGDGRARAAHAPVRGTPEAAPRGGGRTHQGVAAGAPGMAGRAAGALTPPLMYISNHPMLPTGIGKEI